MVALVCLGGGGRVSWQAWQAHVGAGTPGTYTSVSEECRKGVCTSTGDFVASDGGARRTDVGLTGGPRRMPPGATAPARDVGAPSDVYGTASGGVGLVSVAFVLIGAAAAVAWAVMLVRAFRRRHNGPPGGEKGPPLDARR
ncbi:hypothetical protein ACIA5A_15955 [Micromonospora sp. NPDC051300]|uniref:hypothetical protein n=1 Tax=Micromonospora sp. NPDC051300 TaxID=3364286 RepID=UPI0037A5416C